MAPQLDYIFASAIKSSSFISVEHTLSMQASSRASLLGIPPELRLHIYDAILDTDIEHLAIERWMGGHGPGGFWSMPVRSGKTKIVVTWIDLLLTCTTVHAELHAHMERTRPGAYKADIEYFGSALESFVWRKLECSPSDVKKLIVHLNGGDIDHVNFWGDGGPQPIVRQLFQSLNILLHCGPRMDVDHELSSPMHIGTLTIVPSFPDLDSSSQKGDKASRARRNKIAFRWLSRFASIICQQGIVFGLIDRFEVDVGEEVWEMDVQDRGPWVMPSRWHRYGFEWGLDQFDQFRKSSTRLESWG